MKFVLEKLMCFNNMFIILILFILISMEFWYNYKAFNKFMILFTFFNLY